MPDRSIRLFTVPNLITCLNLLAGCVGIVCAMQGCLSVAITCVLLAAVLDFLDGFVARLLKQYSLVGVQLDSLADMVTFGTLPAVMLCCVLQKAAVRADIPVCAMHAVAFSPFLLTVFSALRLAKFNVDDRQATSFLGLPTPANALFFSSLAWIYDVVYTDIPYEVAIYGIPALVLLFCFLLVSEIPMFSLKVKEFSVKKYAFQLALVALSAALIGLSLFKRTSIVEDFAPIILLYIVLSLLKWALTKRK